MKILVLGAGGMAGHVICSYFQESGDEVVGFSRRKLDHCTNINGDVRDFAMLTDIMQSNGFDAVINAVGLLNSDADDNKADAVLINSYLPHFLSSVAASLDTRIVHMSTDCVFSGKTGAYSEHSLKDGDTFYDRSKALGELDNGKDLTFRNSIIGPDTDISGIGLFNWFMKQNGKVKGYRGAVWSGVSTITLAKAMRQALNENLTGLYHLVNNEFINKYELLSIFNKHIRHGRVEIEPYDDFVIDKSLVCTRNDFSFKVPGYEEMVVEMKEWIKDHKEFYPHYFFEGGME